MTEPFNRRRFLSTTAAASAAIGAWPLASRAAEEPAGERIVVAVMGLNGRGMGLARNFASHPAAEVAYLCDPDSQALGKAAESLGSLSDRAPQAIADFRTALDDPRVDALVIAAPDHWHAPATILACTAKKHVYVEKPASHNGQEGEWMVAAARKHERVVQLGNQRRSAPEIRALIERIHTGAIGRALFARGWINSTRPSIGHGKQAPVPENLDYSLWQGPAPEQPYRDNVVHYHWHWFWHWGTGELGNNGIHALDVCRWGLGVDYPDRVTCGGGKLFFNDDQETPDTQLATFHFGDKAIAWEHRTWHPRGFEGSSYGVVFYGDQGSIVLHSDKFTLYDGDGKEVEQASVTSGETEHIDGFIRCVKTGDTPTSEIAEGVASTSLCHLGNIAYRTGRAVRFDPVARRVVGDDEAAVLWGREYRPGWEPVV